VDSLGVYREQLDQLLDVAINVEGDEELLGKVVALANITHANATPAEWESLCQRIRTVFNIDEHDLARALGVTTPPDKSVPLAAPVSFESLVTDGWFGRYLEYTAESEAPAQFHFGAMAACISGALARRPLIQWSVAPTYPNLYVLLIGPTGSRKSSAMKMAGSLVTRAFPTTNILPSEGSQQGYARALRRRYAETARAADGLILASEYGVLVGKDKYKTELAKWLTDWYDCPDKWSRALSMEEFYELDNVYLCLCGCSTMSWLLDLPPDAVKGGHLPRHIPFEAAGRRHRMALPKFDERLAAELIESLGVRLKTVMEHMAFDPSAEKYLVSWYEGELCRQEGATQDEQVLAWYARKQAHVIKLAVVWQVADGGPPDALQAEWLHRARLVLDWCDSTVYNVYRQLGVTEEGAPVEAVLRFIQSRGGKAQQSDIVRAFRNRYNAGRVKGALQTLAAARMLLERKGPAWLGSVWEVR